MVAAVKYDEWYWDDPAVQRIFARSWGIRSPRGQIILIHGLGEHSGRYANLAAYMNGMGWNVAAMDLPGHGKTAGRPGYVRNWHSLVSALENFIRHRRIAGLPLYLYGHSLGGALALQIAIRKSRQVSGVIASAPPIRIVQEVSGWKPVAAKLIGPIIPWLRFSSGIDAEFLSRDKQVVKDYLNDPLVSSRVSSALGLGVLEIGPRLLECAGELDIPALIMHGDADQVADISGSREFCKGAGESCQLLEFPGFYHELHNDIGGRQALAAAAAWLDEVGTVAEPSAASSE